MNINPESTITLLKCPLEQDQENQLTFSDINAQISYFSTIPHLTESDCSYVRETGLIRFPACIDDIRSYNYLKYQNTNYGNKWFYAFITNMTYANDNTTFIEFKIDVIQTWYFELVYKTSFIEREHVANDTMFSNIVSENLECGDFIAASHYDIFDPVQFTDADTAYAPRVVFGATVDAYNPSQMKGGVYDNIPSGCSYYACDIDDYSSVLQPLLQDITDAGRSDAITSIFLLPRMLAWIDADFDPMSDPSRPNAVVNPLNELSNGFTWTMGVGGANFQYKFGTYTPKNNKLYNSEFNYYLLSNSQGNAIILKPELGAGVNPTIEVYATLTPCGSAIACPKGYEGQTINYENALMLGKYPQLNFATDQYTAWLAVNNWSLTKTGISAAGDVIGGYLGNINMAGNIGASAASSLLGGNIGGAINSAINGTISGVSGLLGSFTSGATKIGDIVHEKKMGKRIPPNFGGTAAAGDVMAAINQIRFKIYQMQITESFARRIDSYLSMYGYQVNIMKNVNFTSRTYWNYIKTAQLNVVGEVPQYAIEEVKAIFNKGLTFWHDSTKFLDYSQNNTIVT